MENHWTTRHVQAVKLRRRGLSYGEIRKVMPVSKGTLSWWLKGIRLTPQQRRRLYTKQIVNLSLGSKSQRERRAQEVEQIIQAARKEISLPLSQETHRLMGAALYWAEGRKDGLMEVTNSDPHLIAFMVHWIESVLHIPHQKLKARLNLYPQQHEKKIIKFWSEITGIPVKNFGKTFIKPPRTGYKKNNLSYGTIKVLVPKSVNLRYRTFGWIQRALEDVAPHIATTQRKWHSLEKIQRPMNLLVNSAPP